MPHPVSKIDRKTASKILNVSVRTVDRYIRRGRLLAREEKGRIWLDKKEVMHLSETGIPVRQIPIDTRRARQNVSSRGNTDVDFYRELYEESKRALHEYQQKLEQSNYRIGQLESRMITGVSGRLSAGQLTEQPMQGEIISQELIKREFNDREKQIALFKKLAQQEKMSRIIFAVITYILLALLPLLWYLLR